MALKFHIPVKSLRGSFKKCGPVADSSIFLKGASGCTLMLIHGLTGTPNEMRYLANYFNKRMGYSVVCPRLANHGMPLSVLKKTTWQECYQSAREAFAQVRACSDGPVFVSGLSMGALLALLLADEFSANIAGVSCLSPTLFYDGWNIPWYSVVLLPLFYGTPLKHLFYFKEEPPYGFKSKELQKRVHRHFSKAHLNDSEDVSQYGYPFFPLTLLHQLNRLVRYLTGRLPSIAVPVQLIQAQEDDMTSVRNSLFIYDRISSPAKELVLLNNSYHVITSDQERNTVASKMSDFFNRMMNDVIKTPHAALRNKTHDCTIPENYSLGA